MALFRHHWPAHVPGSEFGSLFRLLDDYDAHRQGRGVGGELTAFAPKFDVREQKDSYVLDGDLPGIDQKDISIEFTDPQTLVIKGRTEREYESGTPPGMKKARVEEEGKQVSTEREAESESKYWVSERSVGEFQRSFSFPTRVNQDGVKASLKRGVLNITVPKMAAPTAKKIAIE